MVLVSGRTCWVCRLKHPYICCMHTDDSPRLSIRGLRRPSKRGRDWLEACGVPLLSTGPLWEIKTARSGSQPASFPCSFSPTPDKDPPNWETRASRWIRKDGLTADGFKGFLCAASCRCGSDGDEPNEEKYGFNEFRIWAGSEGNFDGATLGPAVTQACGSCRSCGCHDDGDSKQTGT